MKMKSGIITKISLKNYKVFDKVEINLNKCNVFVGPNSSGKSSIAEFLIFFRELIRDFSGKGAKSDLNTIDFLEKAFRIGKDKTLIFEIEIIIGEYVYDYYVKYSTKPDLDTIWANEKFVITDVKLKKSVFEASMEITREYPPRFEGMRILKGLGFGVTREKLEKDFSYFTRSVLRRIYQEKVKSHNFGVIEQFYEFWNKIRFYDFNLYDKKKISTESGISSETILSEDFQNLLTVLLNLNFKQNEIFTEIKDWLIQLVPSFKDLTIHITDKKGVANITFTEEGWYNRYAPLNQASDGIIRLLCILTILFNKEKPSLIILDEPENGIHPALRNYIVDFSIATSDDTQVMFLTHDSESLRKFELEMIYYFKRKSGDTEVRQLSDEKSLTETMKALRDIEKNIVVSTHFSDSL